MPSLVILLTAIMIGWLEAPPLWRKRRYKELIAFSVMLAAGAALNIALAMHVPIPNPVDALQMILSPVYRWVHAL